MTVSTGDATIHQASEPPTDADIRAMIGPASWSRYQTAVRGLAELGLEPEFYRYGPSGGWTLRFEVNHVTGCALYLARSLTGLVAVGPRSEYALEEDPKSDDQMRRLVMATPRKGKTRWVQMPLRGQEDVRRFLTLVGVKVRAWQTPKPAKGAKATKPAKATQAVKAKVLSHTPRRQTTAAGADRKKADRSPRRSTARRSSRG
jgi:hypothetical protein